MIKIQPVEAWTPEGLKNFYLLEAHIVFDNLKDSMTLYYQLKTDISTDQKSMPENTFSQQGNLVIDDKDYKNLDTVNGIDVNEEIIRVVLKKLNLKRRK